MALAIGLSATKVEHIDSEVLNYVADLDGANDYISVADSVNLTPNGSGAGNGFTFSVWVYYKNSTAPARGHFIANKYGSFSGGAYRYEYRIQSGYDQKPYIQVFGNDNAGIWQRFKLDLVPSQNTWYHIIFAWDLGTGTGDWKAWVNGAAQTHGSGATHSSNGSWAVVADGINPFYLGSDASSKFGNMKIDEAAIFDRHISDDDAAALYNSGAPGDATQIANLLAYWKFNEGAGTSIEDSSSNSNTATFVNGTAFEQITIG